MRGAEKGQSTEHTHGQTGKRKRKEDSKGTERKGPGAKARNETVCLGPSAAYFYSLTRQWAQSELK